MNSSESSISPVLKRYLTLLMHAHGDQILPGKLQGVIMFDLYNSFMDYLVLNLSADVKDKDMEEFLSLLGSDKEKQLDEFLQKNTNYKKVLTDTLEEFKNNYLGKEEAPEKKSKNSKNKK